MFDKSTGHGNNVMVVQFVFLFLERIIFQESYTEMDISKLPIICYFKKQIDNNSPWSVLLQTTEMI